MTQTKYCNVETYDRNGTLIASESIPYEVSDEMSEKEAAHSAIEELAKVEDEDMTPVQISRFLKALAKLRR